MKQRELEQYYRALGLDVGASLEEINQAYRDLAFIWHPDRIPPDNPRLQEKAAAKLKEINHARDRLRTLNHNSTNRRSAHTQERSQPAPTSKSKYQSPPSTAKSTDSNPQTSKQQPSASQSQIGRAHV